MSAPVLIYTTPACGYCRMAKAFFAENNIAYEEKNVAEDIFARDDMVEKSGQMGVPVIDVRGQIVIGFNKPKLSELLGVTK